MNLVTSTPCREMNDADLVSEILSLCRMVCYFKGQALPEQPAIFAKMVADYLRTTMLTIEQFKTAVGNGMVSDEIYAANAPATYTKWAKQYIESNKHKIVQQNAKVLPEISEAEKLKLIVEGVMHCYYDFKRTGKVFDSGSAVYLFLESLGMIDVSIEDKKKMFDEVRKDAIERLKFKQKESDHFTAKSIGQLIEQAEKGKDVDDVILEQRRICRNKILTEFFTKNELKYETIAKRAGIALDADAD